MSVVVEALGCGPPILHKSLGTIQYHKLHLIVSSQAQAKYLYLLLHPSFRSLSRILFQAFFPSNIKQHTTTVPTTDTIAGMRQPS